jgi:hypothetical protein
MPKKLLHSRIVIVILNFVVITLVWAAQWLCTWLFVITVMDGLVLHLPHDHNYVTSQPYLTLLIIFLALIVAMTIADLPFKLLTEKGIFAAIGHYWQIVKRRPPK